MGGIARGIADHELLQPIAAGSYGEVGPARSAVGTLRALKVVRRDRFERAEDFEREFKGLQRFEPVSRGHDGLVDILQIGRPDDAGWFYYVMELADAAEPQGYGQSSVISHESEAPRPPVPSLKTDYSPRTLRAHFRARGALPAAEVITLGRALTAALAHLHGQGLVHRDIKPSNIFFVGGVPKLADAGLVAAVDDARSLVGTVGYIAPEGPGSPRADLYALAKVLCEAAFGKDRQDFPQLPPDPAARPDHARLLELNAIIARACAHDPKQRYASTEVTLAWEPLNQGRFAEAEQLWMQLKQEQPELANAYFGLGYLACVAGNHAQGLALFEEAIRLEPDRPLWRSWRGDFLWAANQRPAAARDRVRQVELGGFPFLDREADGAALRQVLNERGPEAFLQRLIALAEACQTAGQFVAGFDLARLHAHAGNRALALDHLGTALAEHSGPLLSVNVNPAFKILRDELRFHAVLRPLKLEE